MGNAVPNNKINWVYSFKYYSESGEAFIQTSSDLNRLNAERRKMICECVNVSDVTVARVVDRTRV